MSIEMILVGLILF